MWELWIELITLTHIHYVHTDFCSFLSLKFSLSYIKNPQSCVPNTANRHQPPLNGSFDLLEEEVLGLLTGCVLITRSI